MHKGRTELVISKVVSICRSTGQPSALLQRASSFASYGSGMQSLGRNALTILLLVIHCQLSRRIRSLRLNGVALLLVINGVTLHGRLIQRRPASRAADCSPTRASMGPGGLVSFRRSLNEIDHTRAHCLTRHSKCIWLKSLRQHHRQARGFSLLLMLYARHAALKSRASFVGHPRFSLD
jgi:hypothetical protein